MNIEALKDDIRTELSLIEELSTEVFKQDNKESLDKLRVLSGYEDAGWIAYLGTLETKPPHGAFKIDIKLRNGEIQEYMTKSALDWSVADSGSDIMFWRVAKLWK